jgi:hypothetical protein
MKKPRYEKKKTRPYLFPGLKTGIDFAFLLYGLISGADQSMFTLKPMLKSGADVLQAFVERQGCVYVTSRMEEKLSAACR